MPNECILFSPVIEAYNGPGKAMALRLPADIYKSVFVDYPGDPKDIIFFLVAPIDVEFSKGEKVDILIRKSSSGNENATGTAPYLSGLHQ